MEVTKMKIMYVDPNGHSMQMMSSYIPKFELPVVIRYYRIFESLSIFINPTREQIAKMNKNKRNHPNDFCYFETTLRLQGRPDDMKNWQIGNIEMAPVEILQRFDKYWPSTIQNWHNKYCLESRTIYGNRNNLGEVFYVCDKTIQNISDVTIYMFGKCPIETETLSNVLIFKVEE